MSETQLVSLDSLVDLVTDKVTVVKDPSKPYVGLEHIPSNGSSVLGVGSASDSISTNNVFRSGDTLFGKLRPRLRKSVRVNFDGYCSTDILVLRAKASANADFVSFVLSSDPVFAEAIRTEEGTKMPRCSWSSVRNVTVFRPTSGDAQRRIAEILTTVDEAMEQTEALVGKLEQMKAGLMHDLFTRGVTPDGHLRPTRQDAPHLYHETPLGWLPKEWEAVRMNDLLSGIDAGWSPDCIETPPPLGEWGVLKVSAATRGVFDANESKTLPPKLLPLPELEVKPGDVITARANGVAELVGITVQVPDGCQPRLMLSDKLLRLNPNGRALHSFIAGVMSSAKTRRQLEGVMSGSSGQRNISQTQIRNLIVHQPPVTEQHQFERLMKSIRARLDTESTHLAKLRQQKQGLMQDLLTGGVRVG